MKKIVAVTLLLGMGTGASAQSFLTKANDFLGKVNGAMHGQPMGQPSAQASGGASRPSAMAINQQSAEQQAGQAKALATALQAQIAADRADARPLIDKLVMTSACARDSNAWNSFNRQSEHPQNWLGGLYRMVPMYDLAYHPKNKCLDVIQVVGWTKPAKNALAFRVNLVSAQSDEAAHQNFTLVKSEDSGWLVREISTVS